MSAVLVFASDMTIVGDVLLGALILLLIVGGLVLAFRRPGLSGRGTLTAPSILILVAAAVAGGVAWPTLRSAGFCSSYVVRGANIDHAVDLALLCCIYGSVALRAWRNDTRRLAAALLGSVVLLSASIAFVVLDSATYTVFTYGGGGDVFSCPSDNTTAAHHVWFLYLVWGAVIVLLLVQAVRAFRYRELPSENTGKTASAALKVMTGILALSAVVWAALYVDKLANPAPPRTWQSSGCHSQVSATDISTWACTKVTFDPWEVDSGARMTMTYVFTAKTELRYVKICFEGLSGPPGCGYARKYPTIKSGTVIKRVLHGVAAREFETVNFAVDNGSTFYRKWPKLSVAYEAYHKKHAWMPGLNTWWWRANSHVCVVASGSSASCSLSGD